MQKEKEKIAKALKKRWSLKIYKGTLFVFGIFLVAIFFAWGEEYQVLVAGTATDSVVISLTVAEIISLSAPDDVTMSPDIFGSGISTGATTWVVETNNSTGWKLELNADASPAMRIDSTNYFTDYTEILAGVPEIWNVADTDSEFGFSAEGSYALSKYSGGTLFEGFSGLTKIKVAEDNEPTPGGGAATTINFKAEVGINKNQTAGNYRATIIATASTL